jgi:hypothetical protein
VSAFERNWAIMREQDRQKEAMMRKLCQELRDSGFEGLLPDLDVLFRKGRS